MIIGNTWELIATATGVLIQKHGTGSLTLAYANVEPTNEDRFSLSNNDAQVLPQAGSENIYAIALNGDISISVKTL